MEQATGTATKARELSPAMVKEIQALASAEKRNAEGKATEADLKALVGASATLRREAKKAAGITSPRGKHSDVEIHVNGKNGNAVGWEEWYGIKALAAASGRSLEIVVSPTGTPDAKRMSGEKVAEFFAAMKLRNSGDSKETPSQIAQRIAGK